MKYSTNESLQKEAVQLQAQRKGLTQIFDFSLIKLKV